MLFNYYNKYDSKNEFGCCNLEWKNLFNEIIETINFPSEKIVQKKTYNITSVHEDDATTMYLDVPGFGKDDIKVSITSSNNINYLNIVGNTINDDHDHVVKNSQDFKYKVTISGEANLDKITSKCDKGLLTITIPNQTSEERGDRDVEVT